MTVTVTVTVVTGTNNLFRHEFNKVSGKLEAPALPGLIRHPGAEGEGQGCCVTRVS
jgi:hypothetical protein